MFENPVSDGAHSVGQRENFINRSQVFAKEVFSERRRHPIQLSRRQNSLTEDVRAYPADRESLPEASVALARAKPGQPKDQLEYW